MKQDIVGQRGADCESQVPRHLGVILTTDSQQWPFPATLPSSCLPQHVPTMSPSVPKLQNCLPASSSLPVIQPASQTGFTWRISQGHIPRPQKGAWHVASILCSPVCILCQWVDINPDIYGRRSQKDGLLTHKGDGHYGWPRGPRPRWQLALYVPAPPQA